MLSSKPQPCFQPYMPLKVTRNVTNGDKRINEASKQTSANNLFKTSCQYTQDMFSSEKICFNVVNLQNYDEFLCIWAKIMNLTKE